MPKSNLPSVESTESQTEQTPEVYEGYVSRKIDVKMSRDQAIKFKAILRELEDNDKQLKDGTPVNNKRRAVLWLIENYKAG